MSTTSKLSYATNELPSTAAMYDITQKRQAVKPPDLPIFLSQLIKRDQDELAAAQSRLQDLLLDWPDGMVWSVELK